MGEGSALEGRQDVAPGRKPGDVVGYTRQNPGGATERPALTVQAEALRRLRPASANDCPFGWDREIGE